jgi:VIT1/CCC1 family predicted Fe2+/Mn2+ transporter
MVGLHSSTHLKLAVLGGIFTIAVADAFSDALGIHISEESENVHTAKEIWASTVATFFFKFVVALSFAVPVLLLELRDAVIASAAWGFFLICILSYAMAAKQKANAWKSVFEHLTIAVVVVILSYEVGRLVASVFV